MWTSFSAATASAWGPWHDGAAAMTGGGVDCEAELAVARLRLRLEHDGIPLAERERLRRQEGEEQFEGRLLALALAGIAYVLVVLFG